MFWLLMMMCDVASAEPERIPETANVTMIGQAAPLFSLSTLDGGQFSLKDALGKPVVLAFWASWCGPCRAELPALSEMAAKRDDITVVTVNVDKEKSKAVKFLSGIQMNLPVLMDSDARLMGQLGVWTMPTSFVIDANGTLKFTKVGYSREKGLKEIEAAIAEVLR